MARQQCKVCVSPNRAAIDAGLAQGHSIRAVARRWGASVSGVQRHNTICLPEAQSAHARALAGLRGAVEKQQVVIHVKYDPLPPLKETDPQRIVNVLGRIVARPETSTAVVACASRLAALLQGKELSSAVEAAIAKIEAEIDGVLNEKNP